MEQLGVGTLPAFRRPTTHATLYRQKLALAEKRMKTLDYFRRFFATLFGFILFGVAGVLFKIALLSYTLKSTKGDIKRQLEARRMIGKVWRFFVGYLQWSGVLSVRFNGLEKLGRPGQLILANHPSLLDVVLLISHFPDPNVLVKKDLLHNPSMKSQIIASGYIPNDESMEMLEEIDAVFKSGQSMLIFPEGTRTGWDGQVKMHRGADRSVCAAHRSSRPCASR